MLSSPGVGHSTDCDVLVIGGGPAGSTISALLAEKGWRVIVLEKDHHPRFHVGESLLPMNLPIFARLGVLDEVAKIGLVKPGIELNSPEAPVRRHTFYFENALAQDYPYAFEVRRSEFDALLLANAAARGVAIHQGVKVKDVAFETDGSSVIRARSREDGEQVFCARYVVDASGRDAFLSTRLGLKERNHKHNSAAIFSHLKNAQRRQGRDEGNISLYWFEHGWFWMIPLADGAMSVGAVCLPDYLKTRRCGLDAFFWQTVQLCPGVAERLQKAELIQPVSGTGNYSYWSRRMWGDGYLLLGDAYAFIDPVFSSGIYLAMHNATLAVDAIDRCLREGRTATAALKRYESQVHKGMRVLSWFIYRFTTPAMHDLFMAPRNILRMEEAILSVLAGDVFRKNGLGMPILLFKALYYIVAAANLRRSWRAYRRRQRNLRQMRPANSQEVQSTP